MLVKSLGMSVAGLGFVSSVRAGRSLRPARSRIYAMQEKRPSADDYQGKQRSEVGSLARSFDRRVLEMRSDDVFALAEPVKGIPTQRFDIASKFFQFVGSDNMEVLTSLHKTR